MSARGFSLLELLVVLTLLAVGAAVAAPAVGRAAAAASVRAEVGAIVAFLRAAREQAVTGGRALEVRFDHESRALLMLRAPDDHGAGRPLRRRAVSPALRVLAGPAGVTFLPHGVSSGGRLTVAGAGGPSYLVAVDPLTGRVSMRRPGS
jgi:general secretion pathway protein H